MTPRSDSGVALLLAIGVLLAPVGCGSHGGRLSASGTVNVAGQPLPSGDIVFVPAGQGRAEATVVENGKYHLPRSNGLLPGKYRVEITAMRPTGEKYIDSESGQEEQDSEQYLHPNYNETSQLTAEVTINGENSFLFELTPRGE